jgi:RND family efflux transporter MFP subunit
VKKGQVLAILDASAIDGQIEALSPQLALTKALYEKQQKLWAQDIGTEVQLMSSKAAYEGVQKQIEALKVQRDLYRIISPISGVIDALNLKVGDYSSPQSAAMGAGIRVVSYDKLKAEANLGENYLGKVKQGDPVVLQLPGVNDSIITTLSYVSEEVDAVTRAFLVQVRLGNNPKLHPNMSCIMKIANYTNPKALIVPVSVIQKTSSGEKLYVADGNKAKYVSVTTGKNANGQVEILSGLNPGDKVITVGYEAMEEGQQIAIQ